MDVNLWFAKNSNNEIVSILNSNKEDEYICPICTSKVIPKATESKKVSPHFAHIDVSKCNAESMIHWWYKNKFIQKGDKFKIFTDKDIEFTCKNFNTEVTYDLESGKYRPDLVVETECGQEIVFEMANTNKKKVKDYLDRWIELDKIIVEVDIKSLQNVDDVKKFNTLYYNGKCFNFNTRDGGYYETIGKIKEDVNSDNKYDIKLIKKLDWFWNEVYKYNNKKHNIKHMVNLINSIKNEISPNGFLLDKILKRSHCSNLYKDYRKFVTLDDEYLFLTRQGNESILELINHLHKSFKYLDSNFCIDGIYKEVPKYESYFNGSRKYPYKYRVSDINYHIVIRLQYNFITIAKLIITNRVMDNIKNVNYIRKLLIDNISKGKYFKCKECNKNIRLSSDELKYYLKNNLHMPKRCQSCRKKRKEEAFN